MGILWFCFSLTCLFNSLVCIIVTLVGIDYGQSYLGPQRHPWPPFRRGGLGSCLITFPEILPLCFFCNKVTFDLYGENSVYLFMKILHWSICVLDAYVKHVPWSIRSPWPHEYLLWKAFGSPAQTTCLLQNKDSSYLLFSAVMRPWKEPRSLQAINCSSTVRESEKRTPSFQSGSGESFLSLEKGPNSYFWSCWAVRTL